MSVDLHEWCQRIITSPGGFREYVKREIPDFAEPREVEIAKWVVRCLGNLDNEGSAQVIEAILERRTEQAKERKG